MSARIFLGVILSDERSEESKEPFERQQSRICCYAKWQHSDFSQR
jgi:hypothetical protein